MALSMKKDHNKQIIQSWTENASLWANAVRTDALESRRLVTNDAILSVICTCEGKAVLDVGCGEGWLSHELVKREKHVTGFDGSADLVELARKKTQAKFHVSSYETFVADPRSVGHDFEVAVCNFSLLDEHLHEILTAIHSITKPSGHLIIQTLHPYSSAEGQGYEDGWREETFQGLPGQWSSMPWYFRTMSSWVNELIGASWKIKEMKEPLHPVTGKPVSLILDLVK